MKEKVIFTVGEIVSAVGGKLIKGNPEMSVSSVTTDSRMSDMDDLFIPLKGEKFDGHHFIKDILSEKRMKGFLYSSSNSIPEIPDDCFAIEVKDTLHALGRLSSFHRNRVQAEVIGITGTNGKTTTKELIAQIFSQKYKTLKSEKNYNNEVGVPFTLFRLSKEDRYAVIEMGMNHSGEISRLSSYAQPDSALITNAGEGHLEFLGTVENVAKAKSEIMEPMKKGSFIFLNKDSEALNVMESRAQSAGLKVISFGLKNADISPENFKLSADRIDYTLMGKKYSAPLYGIHNLYNLLASSALSLYYGITSEQINEAFASFENVGKRSEISDSIYTVINDTYNSNPLSLRSALNSIGMIYKDRRKIVVISDMKELGDKSEFYHRAACHDAVSSGFEYLLTYGEYSEYMYKEAVVSGGIKAEHFDSKEDLLASLYKLLKKDDVVLVKGSRSMKMEEVAEKIIRV